MGSENKIRVLLVKSGLDYHDRGVRYMARKFREAGMEVIYFQYRVVPEVAKAAIQEDVDVIGVSSSVGGYVADVADLRDLLKQQGIGDMPIIVGGIIAERDFPALRNQGIDGIFGPGSSADDAVEWINLNVVKAG